MIVIHRNRGWIRRYWRDLAARDERRRLTDQAKVAALIAVTDELVGREIRLFAAYYGEEPPRVGRATWPPSGRLA